MATASSEGERKGTRRMVVPLVTYLVVLALVGWAGYLLWTWGRSAPPGSPGSGRVSPAAPQAAGPESARTVQGLNLPRPVDPKVTAPAQGEPAQVPAISSSPSQSETSNSAPAASTPTEKKEPAQEPAVVPAPSPSNATSSDPAGSAPKQAEPLKSTCTTDVGAWPVSSADQVKAIQLLLRDLEFYGGTTQGTLGPATRAAIRKFQHSTDQAETGEPSEMLFEALKKRCTSSAR